MLETRQRFRELRTAWVCKLLITESCFAARQTFGAIPRLLGRADKKQTFRKRLRNTWNVPRGEIKRYSLKHTVSRKLWWWFMSKQAGKLLFFKKIAFDWIFSTKRRFVTDLAQRIVTNLTSYSKKFLTPSNGVRAHCQSGRLNFLEKVDYNIFLALSGVWYRFLSHLSF